MMIWAVSIVLSLYGYSVIAGILCGVFVENEFGMGTRINASCREVPDPFGCTILAVFWPLSLFAFAGFRSYRFFNERRQRKKIPKATAL